MNEHKNDIVKYCAYSLLLLALYVLQTARGTSLSLWGLQLDVIPFFVVTLALFEGPYGAGSLGFAAGLLCAVGSPVLDGLLALYYGVLGVLCGMFALRYMRRVLPSALLLGCWRLCSRESSAICFITRSFSTPRPAGPPCCCSATALSHFCPAALVFFIVRAIYLRFAEKDEA